MKKQALKCSGISCAPTGTEYAAAFRIRFKPYSSEPFVAKNEKTRKRLASLWLTIWRVHSFELFVGVVCDGRIYIPPAALCPTKYTAADGFFWHLLRCPYSPKKTNFRRANIDGLIHTWISSEMRWEFLPSEFLCIYKKNRCSSLRRRASYVYFNCFTEPGLDRCVHGYFRYPQHPFRNL